MNRRAAIPLTAASLLLLVGAMPASAAADPIGSPEYERTAQRAAERAGANAFDWSDRFDGHPLIGSWLVDPQPQDPSNPYAIDTFFEDGTIRHAGGAVGGGAWVPTGPNTANTTMTWVEVADDGRWGTVTIRGTVEVSADGLTWSGGSVTIEFSEGMAEVTGSPEGEFGPLPQASAQRIGVEVMDPIGPMPGGPA